MSNREAIPITLISSGIDDPIPVHLDPGGLPTYVTDEPALLSDGKSIVSPIYVIDTEGQPWRNKSNQLIASIGVASISDGA